MEMGVVTGGGGGGGGSDSGMEPTPDSSLCSVDTTPTTPGGSENGSEASGTTSSFRSSSNSGSCSGGRGGGQRSSVVVGVTTSSSSAAAKPPRKSLLSRSVSVRLSGQTGNSPLTSLRSPSENDGRWPSNTTRNNLMSVSIGGPIPERSHHQGRAGGVTESSGARRRRRSAENLAASSSSGAGVTPTSSTTNGSTSKSGRDHVVRSREASLNRTASLRRRLIEEAKAAAASSPSSGSSSAASGRSSSASKSGGGGTSSRGLGRPSSSGLTPPQHHQPRVTLIYLEQGTQTGLTGQDLEAAVAGVAALRGCLDPALRPLFSTVAVQVEGGLTLEELQKLTSEKQSLEERAKRLTEELAKERKERAATDERIRKVLRLGAEENICDFIEAERQKTSDIVHKQQVEINQLHTLCCNLKKEMERRQETERRLAEEAREAECESLEIQEFLTAEKSALGETLKELEQELVETKAALTQVTSELKRQEEEKSHLVRVSEQIRQEKLSVESRLRRSELRAKEAMLLEGAAVSGASVALSGLGSRLELLVSALVTAYQISPQDLEDVVYHNEAYEEEKERSGGGSSCTDSGESSSSALDSPVDSGGQLLLEEAEKRRGGLLAVILSAIQSATQPRRLSRVFKDTCNSEEAGRELPAEGSEPQESVVVSPLKSNRTSSVSPPPPPSLAPDDISDLSLSENACGEEQRGISTSQSLQNLSEAILARQRCDAVESLSSSSLLLLEDEDLTEILGGDEEEPASNSGGVGQIVNKSTLIDQVIEVDNLVTKLLRVLHIIEASRTPNRTNGDNDAAHNANETIDILKAEIQDLKNKLNNADKSVLQIEDLQNELREKENRLLESEKKYELTQELLTNNYHKAMSEVRRLYQAIDNTRQLIEDAQDDFGGNHELLERVRQGLLDSSSSLTCSSWLPVSTSSRADLNANPTPSAQHPPPRRPLNTAL